MHIILVCREYVGSARSGGIGSYMHEIAKAYVAGGHTVTVVTASDDTECESESVDSYGIHVISLSGGDFFVPSAENGTALKKLRCIYRFYSYRKKLARIVSGITDADIVEVADFGAEGLYLSKLHIPVVIRLHTPQSLSIADFSVVRPKWWRLHRSLPIFAEKIIFERARYITGCSQAILDWVGNNYNIKNAMTAVVKNPIEISADIRDTPHTNDNSVKTIFFAGTISDTKGVGDLVEACDILRHEGFEIRLKLAGKGGSFQTMLRQKIIENGWDWIEFLGKLPRERVYDNYTTADVCCFPSWWENMPMVVIESMALGAVVVSTDAGGIGEIITNGHDGFLCERRNPATLASTLRNVLSLDDDQRLYIKHNAQATVRENFTVGRISEEMLAFFDKVIKNFNGLRK